MTTYRQHLRTKAAPHRRTSQPEALGLHAAILLVALAAVLITIAG